MSKSRVVNSAVNTIFNFSVKLFDFGIKFVLRTVFIYTLGMQYVGVSGLFTDILSVLSFVELGICSAITYASSQGAERRCRLAEKRRGI